MKYTFKLNTLEDDQGQDIYFKRSETFLPYELVYTISTCTLPFYFIVTWQRKSSVARLRSGPSIFNRVGKMCAGNAVVTNA